MVVVATGQCSECAGYSKNLKDVYSQYKNKGLEILNVYYMDEEELRKSDRELSSFRNINTQEDLKDFSSEE